MKVSTIHQTNNFGRVIQMQNVENNELTRRNAKQLVCVLNNSDKSKYSKAQEVEIRDFFMDVLGDYNGHDGVMTRKTQDGRNFLISGQDAKDIKQIVKRQYDSYKNEKLTQHQKKAVLEANHIELESEINQRLENGKRGKADSFIRLYSDLETPNIPVIINYESYSDKKEPKDSNYYNSFQTVEYYNKTLDLTI